MCQSGAAHAGQADRRNDIIGLVAATYRLHGDGSTTNPDSYFLRFPEKPNSRIIALPARLMGPEHTAGIKWIATFPDNYERRLPRRSPICMT